MPRILAVDDDRSYRRSLVRTLSDLGFDVVEAEDGIAAQEELAKGSFDLVVTDLNMPRADGFEVIRAVRAGWPRLPVVMLTSNTQTCDAVTAIRAGATDFLTKPHHHDELAQVVRAAIAFSTTESDDERVTARPQAALLGDSETLRALLARVELVARSDGPVAFAGENGSGMEAFARLIHGLSKRSAEPFVRVGCLGCNDGTLLQAVERAGAGTLFLDDVSCLDRSVQATLSKVVSRGGARVVAATERMLAPLVETESFDRHLALALADVTLTMPPLRTRPEDVPILVRHFLDDANRRHGRKVEIGDAQIGALQAYRFPGNVGELQTMVDRLVRFEPRTDNVESTPAKPTAAIEASLLLFDGTRRAVAIDTAGREIEALFAGPDAFFATNEQGKSRVYSRVAVAAISIASAESAHASGFRSTKVSVHMTSGATIEGEIRWVPGVLHSSVVDVLREPSVGMTVHAGDRRHLVAKSHVAWVEEVS